MHIIYVINQHHCDKIKDYPHVDHQIKKYFYSQYIKSCLWLVFYFFCDKEQKLFTLPCLDPIHIMICNVHFNRNNTSLEIDCKGHN